MDKIKPGKRVLKYIIIVVLIIAIIVGLFVVLNYKNVVTKD